MANSLAWLAKMAKSAQEIIGVCSYLAPFVDKNELFVNIQSHFLVTNIQGIKLVSLYLAADYELGP